MNPESNRTYFPVRSFLIIILLIVLFQWIIPKNRLLLYFFIDFIFTPIQRLKALLFNLFPFSIGDILYSALVLMLMYFFARWIFLLYKIRIRKSAFLKHSYHFLLVILWVIFSFSFTWNANYNRPRISQQFSNWPSIQMNDSMEKKLNRYILASLNALDTQAFSVRSQKEWNKMIEKRYRETYRSIPDLTCKPSLFGRLIQAMGIQGYYNPLTSEAQINAGIPGCLQPFVIAHEMAHLMGIASEGDANFVAYQICSQSSDPYIQYSALLNLYLYNARRLKNTDSVYVLNIQASLPDFFKNDLDTIRRFNETKPFSLNQWTIPFYNWFLKFNGEQQGIRSYGTLTKYVYVQEMTGKKKADIPIRPYQLH